MNLEKLEDILKDESKYRLAQVKKALFSQFIKNWDEATVLAKKLREKLKEISDLEIIAEDFVSKDDRTIKSAITLSDGARIETVLMQYAGRNTVCISSQVGCPMGCAFCATGKMGIKRNLTKWEIVEQVLHFARQYPISNVVVMGMGEPFLNYDNVVAALKILNDKDGFNIGVRHLSISTCGIIPGIQKLSDEDADFNLAISLHAPNNKLRDKLMPVNKQYPIEKLLATVDEYVAKKGRKVMFEYLMIKGINDSEKDARELAVLLHKPLYFVNLIPYNPTPRPSSGCRISSTDYFEPSDTKTVQRFKTILLESGIRATERFRFGQDIEAACGQLVGKI